MPMIMLEGIQEKNNWRKRLICRGIAQTWSKMKCPIRARRYLWTAYSEWDRLENLQLKRIRLLPPCFEIDQNIIGASAPSDRIAPGADCAIVAKRLARARGGSSRRSPGSSVRGESELLPDPGKAARHPEIDGAAHSSWRVLQG
jgi:hypothetical protein